VLLNERVVDPVGPDKRGQQRAKEKRVGTGTNREMQIRHFGGFGSPGINDDQLACGILADLIEMIARIGEAVRDPGICTDDKQEIAVMHVLGGVARLAAEHVAIDPEVAGFFLRKGVEDAARTQRAQQSIGVGAAGVVALPATAVKGYTLAAIPVYDVSQPLRDFCDRHVPLDFIEAAVRATAQRGREPIPVTRIIWNPGRFVAQIAL
jgi:hypothetical protein